MRGEMTVEVRPAAGVGRIQQEVLEIHRDEFDRALKFVAVRAAIAETVVRVAQAEAHRADLPAGEIQQARVARELALRRAVVEVRELMDDRRQRRARGRILGAGILRSRHPGIEQRAIQQQAPRLCTAVDLRGQVVAPFHFDASIQRVRPDGGQPLDGVRQEFARGRGLGRCQ